VLNVAGAALLVLVGVLGLVELRVAARRPAPHRRGARRRAGSADRRAQPALGVEEEVSGRDHELALGDAGSDFDLLASACTDRDAAGLVEVKLGATKKFLIHNVSHQIHVFHLHGYFFQVVDTDDAYDPVNNPFGLRREMMDQAQKDSITVRSGYSVTVVARFDQEPGRWIYHCHIPEHSERGMMSEIRVVP